MEGKDYLFVFVSLIVSVIAYLSFLPNLSEELFISQGVVVVVLLFIAAIGLLFIGRKKNVALCFFALFFGISLVNMVYLFLKHDIGYPFQTAVIYAVSVVGFIMAVLMMKKKSLKPIVTYKRAVEVSDNEYVELKEIKPKKVVVKKTKKKKVVRKKKSSKRKKR